MLSYLPTFLICASAILVLGAILQFFIRETSDVHLDRSDCWYRQFAFFPTYLGCLDGKRPNSWVEYLSQTVWLRFFEERSASESEAKNIARVTDENHADSYKFRRRSKYGPEYMRPLYTYAGDDY